MPDGCLLTHPSLLTSEAKGQKVEFLFHRGACGLVSLLHGSIVLCEMDEVLEFCGCIFYILLRIAFTVCGYCIYPAV